jgi:adenine-specific DNA-methyltransferase
MTFKRRALGALTRVELLEIGRSLELDVSTGMRLDELIDTVAGSKRATLERILPALSRDTLKSICFAIGEPAEGREKQIIVDRILAASGADERPAAKGKKARDGANAPSALTPPAPIQPSLPWVAPVVSAATAPAPAPRPRVETRDEQAAPTAPLLSPTMRASAPSSREITLEVTARKPRLAWQGMWRKEAALSVPSQVVEIVRPGRAVDRGPMLSGIETRTVEARDVAGLPANRLIWTNDNLVALQTLLDEKDPVTRDWRYRGKVDLVYIDPPFMVNNDFRADNTVDIDLDDEAHVQVKKEPSLVEILAYKDTWRQGLDSFLTMLRRRLELLKELLAPTGSIYIHLDWHAVHYVKVLMDEVFGYENLMNEIIWQRQTSHNDLAQGARHLGRVHDTILVYGGSDAPFVAPVYTPYDGSYVSSHYGVVDEKGRRFQYGDLSGPGGAAKGNPYYELFGHTRYWRYSEERAYVNWSRKAVSSSHHLVHCLDRSDCSMTCREFHCRTSGPTSVLSIRKPRKLSAIRPRRSSRYWNELSACRAHPTALFWTASLAPAPPPKPPSASAAVGSASTMASTPSTWQESD